MTFKWSMIIGGAFGGGIAACAFLLWHLWFIWREGAVMIVEPRPYMLVLDVLGLFWVSACLTVVFIKVMRRRK